MKKPPELLLNFVLALFAAVLLILIFPNPAFENGAPWLAPLALTPLLVALYREPRPLWRFLLGESAGIVYWLGVCYWIQFVLEVHGGMGRWGGWGTFLLFCVAKAIHLGVFSLFAAILIRTGRFAIPAIAALWTGIERTHSTFGFAWLDLGNAAIDMALPLRLAPFIGVYGISFLFALIAATIAIFIIRRDRRQLLWLVALLVPLILPEMPERKTGAETAVAIQPNMPEEEEWTYASLASTRDHLIAESRAAALRNAAKIVIWPESPGPLYYYEDPVFREEAASLARDTHVYFLLGTVGQTPQGAPLNSAVLLRPDGDLEDRYDKINLVPFGEYVPQFFGFVHRITKEAGDFAPGTRFVIFPIDGHNMGAYICYEAAFPHEVRVFVKNGANLLINISNDGYFGKSSARAQHLEIARMRAVENRRWILRVTNDGITADIDPAGRMIHRWPMYQELVARMGFNYVTGTTLYTQLGDWFAWGCLFASFLALFFSQMPHYTPRRSDATRGGSPTHRRP